MLGLFLPVSSVPGIPEYILALQIFIKQIIAIHCHSEQKDYFATVIHGLNNVIKICLANGILKIINLLLRTA